MISRLTRWILDDAGLADFAPLRYMLGKPRRTTWWSVPIYVLLAATYMYFLIVIGHWLGQIGGTASERVSNSFYLPTVAAQALVSAAAFASSLHFIHGLRRRQSLDALRATAGGTSAAIRAAWAATVYYRLRTLLGVLVFAPRVVLLALLLWDLTAFRGDYLMQIAGGHQPVIPPLLELPLMGAFIAAAFLLPISAIGLEVAVGLLFSTFARTRQTAGLIQVLLTVARTAWSIIPVLLLSDVIGQAATGQAPHPLAALATMLVGGAAGDWGLSMLNAAAVDALWAAIPYAAYVGIALLGVVILQSALTVLVLRWAAGRAQRID